MNSFAPPHYGLPANYVIRTQTEHHDDTSSDGHSQEDVYRHAANWLQQQQLPPDAVVVDIGCGNALKLQRFIHPHCRTVGVELPPLLDHLRRTYPNDIWLHAYLDRSKWTNLRPVLVICADVVEHVQHPERLLLTLVAMQAPVLISTPCRQILATDPRYAVQWGPKALTGPPINRAHVREWTRTEFEDWLRYLGLSIQHSAYGDLQPCCQYHMVTGGFAN